ncbi:TauE superfamily protein [Candidatus Planktophila lacus]|uniref:sulfite exporter TauE/SafE family protein n=1 Tax=Candidatus Planktophila lacus TaxID=1884913 RepID=UPI000BAC68A3|nr:TSUP family transporter [Candidatus Planktophila lacus]ASY25263.1 TauE superfamily protein [Candidatus Planktophila lacus]
MFADLTLYTLAFLAAAAFCAGLIDAIAGGGGLIQLPAMLIGLAKTETVVVLGTNKVPSIFGTTVSALTYRRNIKVSSKLLIVMAIPAFIGSMGGASLASLIPTEVLKPLVVALLIAVLIYTWKRPQLGQIESMRHSESKRLKISAVAALVIGFYDGIIGPGTGSFLILLLVAVMGFAFLSASAIAKVVNVATNGGAILVFGVNGEILWKIGLTLAIANVCGGLIGVRIALRGGSGLVRKVFMGITAALILKVAFDTFTALR